MTNLDSVQNSEALRIGILGGGQLARMMGLAGIPLGLKFVFLDPSPDACAARTGKLLQAEYADLEKVRALAHEVDIASFDFENVPAKSAREISALRPFYPGVNALEDCQDRLSEKRLLQRLGVPVPAFREVGSRPGLLSAIDELGLPSVLKTRRLGYDGKGQAVLQQMEDLEPAWQRLGHTELILERWVPFEAECSLIAVRGQCGQIQFWPLVKNVHENGVLVLSLPGVFSRSLQQQAEQIARRLLMHWQYIGVMTMEFFIHEGVLMVNEIAPRVHNSGHWTIDGAMTSQFENHLRAICGLPLGATSMRGYSLMFNWLSVLPDKGKLLSVPGLHWHDYGKTPRPGRKLGHATLATPDSDELKQAGNQLAAELGGHWPQLLSRLW